MARTKAKVVKFELEEAIIPARLERYVEAVRNELYSKNDWIKPNEYRLIMQHTGEFWPYRLVFQQSTYEHDAKTQTGRRVFCDWKVVDTSAIAPFKQAAMNVFHTMDHDVRINSEVWMDVIEGQIRLSIPMDKH